MFTTNLSPFLKWPGGKSSELHKISEAAPKTRISRFVEPFVGGGSVLLSVDSSIPALANDICPELIDLYKSGSINDGDLKSQLLKLSQVWDFITLNSDHWKKLSEALMTFGLDADRAVMGILEIVKVEIRLLDEVLSQEFARRISKDLPSKLRRMQKIQIDRKRILPLDEFSKNVEGSIRAAFYMAVRQRYNRARIGNEFTIERTADFLFLREYCYASMFRFNSKGEFNIPYGGISYNRKHFNLKIEKLFDNLMRERLNNTEFFCLDFEEFLGQANLIETDFVFIDPPYDSDFTDYDGRKFRNKDQERLANCLNQISSKVMIVIGDTELIRKLYRSPKWTIQRDDMQYKWTIKSRNERLKTHLTITNY